MILFFTACMLYYTFVMLRSTYFFHRLRCREEGEQPFVSVIIPARNEEAHIESCLRSVLQQSYPLERMEVILVDDDSTDETGNIGDRLAKEYPNLRVLHQKKKGINSYKKAAIEAGIRAAKGEILLMTDGDCEVKEGWVAAMMKQFDEQTAFVSGPVWMRSGGRWLETFQTLEYMGLMVIGGGSMEAGKPNMCNGANLAYRKAVFEEVKGFQGIDGVASGDDELLMQKIAALKKYKLRFAKCSDAIVSTDALSSWQQLKQQRLRWVSKAKAYHNKGTNITQLISYLAFLGIPSLLIASFWDTHYLWASLSLFGLKCLADLPLMLSSSHFFQARHLMRYFFHLQCTYLIYVLWVGIAGNLVKRYEWKGRKVS